MKGLVEVTMTSASSSRIPIFPGWEKFHRRFIATEVRNDRATGALVIGTPLNQLGKSIAHRLQPATCARPAEDAGTRPPRHPGLDRDPAR